MDISKNQQRLAISMVTAAVIGFFSGCSEPLSDKVNITANPERPQVQSVGIGAPIEDDDDASQTIPGLEAGIDAPYFQFDFNVENDTDKVFVLYSLQLISELLETGQTSTVTFDVNTLSEEEIDPNQPFSLARIPANTEWPAAENLGITINSTFVPRFFGVGGLPQDREFGEQPSTLYRVQVRALGFFEGDETSEDPDDDDEELFERTYTFFTK